MILDFATSATAEGKVRVARNKGVAIPPDCLVDAEGNPTTDPNHLYTDPPGSLLPFGGAVSGHKGGALWLMCELLAGGITGGGCSKPLEDKSRFSSGMLSIVIAPQAYGDAGAIGAEIERYLGFVKSSRPREPGGEVLLPGEPERARQGRAQRGRHRGRPDHLGPHHGGCRGGRAGSRRARTPRRPELAILMIGAQRRHDRAQTVARGRCGSTPEADGTRRASRLQRRRGKRPGDGRQVMAEVDIRKVDKFFGSTQVLHEVEIGITDGEFVVLVGPSGCGKSTLLRMIAGLEEISKGDIAIGGRVVNNVPPKDRDIAMVFQNYALYPHMTVFNNMAFSLKLAKAPKDVIQERVGRAASILGLTEYPRALSAPAFRRPAPARRDGPRDRARPAVFLFDEPLSNLDAKLRVQMRTEIKELHQRLKTTAVYVTHDQIEAMTMADRIVVLHDGVVEQVGDPLLLYDEPANLFVAGFLGSPAMNFLDATHQAQRRRAERRDRGRHGIAAARECRRPGRPAGGLRHPARASRPDRYRQRPGRRGRGGRADRRRDPGVRAPRGSGDRGGVQGAAPVPPGRQDHPDAARRHDPSVRQGLGRARRHLTPGRARTLRRC